MQPTVARQMLRTLEPYHALVYFVPEAESAYVALGLREGRMCYFAPRAAPMGAVPPELVIATFFGFQPDLIRAVIPTAWSLASPEAILETRLAVVDAGLGRILGSGVLTSPDMVEAAALVRRACEGCDVVGRALYAGHAALPWPGSPHLDLWHGVTLLREFRGDGHNAIQAAAGFGGCDAMVMHRATNEIPAEYAASRGWSASEWDASVASLRDRGLLDAEGSLTDAGRTARRQVEGLTDERAMVGWERIGADGCQRLREIIRPFSRAIAEGVFPNFNGTVGRDS
jgi:hypothetical protein